VSRIAIVTDSASDIGTLALEAGVRVVPLDVRLGSRSPAEISQLSLEEFWHLCVESTEMPETSAPSPGAFENAFLKAKDDGADGVVCVTLSSRLSATYQAACAGAAAVEKTIAVFVIDSRTVTMGEGMAVLEAARLADKGADMSTIREEVQAQLDKTLVFGALDTLDYLRRGGRIGAAQAMFGSLLSIKPVIEVKDGIVVGTSKQRTRARSLRYLAELAGRLGPLRRLAIVHAAASEDDLALLLELLKPLELEDPPTVGYLGPVIGAHSGPGTIGICALRA
jgi:DegV family protein with EDD domain